MSTPNSPIVGSEPWLMSRRDAVVRIALLMGGAFVGSQALLSGQVLRDTKAAGAFTDADIALLDEIGESIIPATSIPGAKSVHIGAFMTIMVNDCYNARQHVTFVDGLTKVNAASKAKYGKGYMDLSRAQRTELANALETEQRAQYANRGKDEEVHYFRLMKELTILGFYSSEVGCTQALRYVEVPGAFHGDVPYKKGDPAWF